MGVISGLDRVAMRDLETCNCGRPATHVVVLALPSGETRSGVRCAECARAEHVRVAVRGPEDRAEANALRRAIVRDLAELAVGLLAEGRLRPAEARPAACPPDSAPLRAPPTPTRRSG